MNWKIATAIAMIWFAGWIVTFPALLADFQSVGDDSHAFSNYRRDLGAAMLFALLPQGWIVAPFVTGFYKHGFQIWRRL